MPADTESRPQPPPDQPGAPKRDDPGEMPPGDAFKSAVGQLSELIEYARQYLTAQVDLVRLRVRRAIILAVIGIVALLTAATLIVTLVVMFCRGLSGMIAQALGGRAWAGELIVSCGFIAILTGGGWLALRTINRKHLKETVKRYEQRRRQQLARFGQNSADGAGEHREKP